LSQIFLQPLKCRKIHSDYSNCENAAAQSRFKDNFADAGAFGLNTSIIPAVFLPPIRPKKYGESFTRYSIETTAFLKKRDAPHGDDDCALRGIGGVRSEYAFGPIA
jgi:hypothetical protein